MLISRVEKVNSLVGKVAWAVNFRPLGVHFWHKTNIIGFNLISFVETPRKFIIIPELSIPKLGSSSVMNRNEI